MAYLPLVDEPSRADDGGMFAPYCPRHGSHVLLSADDLSVRNTAAGIEVVWRCSCGHVGRRLTGAAAPAEASADRACA